MSDNSFNKIVKILGNKRGKVLFKKDIFEFIDPECKLQYAGLCDKLIYRLRAQEYIVPIKSGVYIVLSDTDKQKNIVDLIDDYYLKLLKKCITENVGSQYYISGQKSLEFHMRDMSLPERIYIINRSLTKKIKIGNYELIFKNLSGKYQGKTLNLYSKFSSYTKDIELDNIGLKISGLELSLLETALVNDMYEGLQVSLLVKALKKYGSVLNPEIFQEVGKYKYNMSFNRLKEIAKPMNHELYELFLDIIKKNGGCFVGQGLRGI